MPKKIYKKSLDDRVVKPVDEPIRKPGRPRSFTPEALEDKFKEYIEYCSKNERFANIDGFSVFAFINPDTYYEYKHQAQYSEPIKRIEGLLLDDTLNKALEARNPAFLIFYLKNKFNWKDKQEIETTGNVVNTLDLSKFSVKQLKEMAKDDK